MNVRELVKSLPVIGPLARVTLRAVKRPRQTILFTNSGDYWEKRYQSGNNSGSGSYNRLAEFKADFLNRYVAENNIQSVIEFGSGDGAQLALAKYPRYIGVDISLTAIDKTRAMFNSDPSISFMHTSEVRAETKAELSLSLDVVYHLVEDDVYFAYMRQLFDAAERAVVVYASNFEGLEAAPHVRHRKFTDWIEKNRPEFALKHHVANPHPFDLEDRDNTSFADFYVFERV